MPGMDLFGNGRGDLLIVDPVRSLLPLRAQSTA
jgi:hypothetical protein